MKSNQRQRLESESSETRVRLLEVGTHLFAESGFKGASVRELCAEAGANIAAVRYHFGGKEGLYRAVFEDTLDEDESRFRDAMDNINTVIDNANSDRNQLGVALELYIKSFFARFPLNEHKRWFSVLVMRELSFPGQGFDLIYERRANPSLQVLARIVAASDGIDANSESARLQAHALNGTIMGVIISRNILLRTMRWQSFTPEKMTSLLDAISKLLYSALSLTPPQSMQSSGDAS
ncbi:MAG: CerR family C-terminal domain-containing protein [Gammaproteobacteria bacterium]|nr:CerR family C-terminal domain-containing protein [Gammaproteobacteria bacterium]